jgi:hypothetical protein
MVTPRSNPLDSSSEVWYSEGMNEAMRIIREALSETHDSTHDEHCAYLKALLDAEAALIKAGAA